jgi:hypothetical protein
MLWMAHAEQRSVCLLAPSSALRYDAPMSLDFTWLPPLLARFTLADFILLAGLAVMLTLPGWVLLSLSNVWRERRLLQRWALAVSLSIATYPALLYGLRLLGPWGVVPRWGWFFFFAACLLVLGVKLANDRTPLPRLARREAPATLAVLAVLGLSLLSRALVPVQEPFPAWSDSLHHALLTRLTAEQGQLPWSLLPYADVPLTMYHLGLYSLSGVLAQVVALPAHSALLWTAQVLNALSVVGVFLVLDRWVGRTAAVAGMAAVALFGQMPAYYANWGRFTQLSAQTILLPAWLLVWETAAGWRGRWTTARGPLLWGAFFAALLTAGTFLLHFRAAAFYVALLLPAVAGLVAGAIRRKETGATLTALLLIGGLSLLLVAPVLIDALRYYLAPFAQETAVQSVAPALSDSSYFKFNLADFPYLVAPVWLMALAGLGLLLGLLRRNGLALLTLAWLLLLFGMGYLYLTGSRMLAFTNLGAVLIMLYLPIGLLVGAGVGEALRFVAPSRQGWANGLTSVGLVVAALFFVQPRALELEFFRFFVTPTDRVAFAWIDEHLPDDAAFVVNTYPWFPSAPHGTDAGYWLPYATGNRTSAGTMLSNLGRNAHTRTVIEASALAVTLAEDPAAMAPLAALGYRYLFLGARGNFEGASLSAEALEAAGVARILFRAGDSVVMEATVP